MAQTNQIFSESERPYFYPINHLGSSSWITNNAGTPVQSITYLPYGKVFINQQSTSYDAVYKFIGKERDSETGFDLLDNRYYSSDLGMFISTDPLAHLRSWMTPYNYSQNSPINRSDPSGLLDDEYKFDKQGNHISTTPNNSVDKLVIVGGKKNIESKNFDAGTFKDKIRTEENGNTFIEGLSRGDANDVFDFMSDKTDVEWGHMETNINGITNTLVGTGHNPDGETAVYPEAMKSPEGSVVQYDHSHTVGLGSSGRASTPKNAANYSKYCDTEAWGALLKRNPNASMGIRHQGWYYEHIFQGKPVSKDAIDYIKK